MTEVKDKTESINQLANKFLDNVRFEGIYDEEAIFDIIRHIEFFYRDSDKEAEKQRLTIVLFCKDPVELYAAIMYSGLINDFYNFVGEKTEKLQNDLAGMNRISNLWGLLRNRFRIQDKKIKSEIPQYLWEEFNNRIDKQHKHGDIEVKTKYLNEIYRKWHTQFNWKTTKEFIKNLQPWLCIWDYYMMAHDMVQKGISEDSGNTYFNAWKHGLGFVINLGSALICLPLPFIRKDNQYRFHSNAGPSIKWDSTEYHFWHGIRVNKELIETPERINLKEFFKESNMEIRRCLCEHKGYDWILERLQAKRVQKDNGGELLEADLNDDNGKLAKFVKVKCPSSGREYVLRVDPETKTCLQGIASTFQFGHGDYTWQMET